MRNLIVRLLQAAFTVGCTPEAARDDSRPEAANKPESAAVTRGRGQRRYARHCARCHGAPAQGADNWAERRAGGGFGPPPLNGTGHSWHHPEAALMDITNNGT